jgi:hypothetical protein
LTGSPKFGRSLFAAGAGIRPADGHCGLLSESMRPLGSGKAIRCPTEWRSSITPEAKAWLVSLACDKAKEHGYAHEL